MPEPSLDVVLRIACDRNYELGARDDAVGELSFHEGPAIIEALLRLGSDTSEEYLIQAAAGESLGEIWVRTGIFSPHLLETLTPTARSEATGIIRLRRPDWL